MKKQPPTLVKAKRPTIVKDDPFQTQKEEDGIYKLFTDAYDKFQKAILAELSKEIDKRELADAFAGIADRIIGAGMAELETDDLYLKGIEFVKKGYIKGVILGSQSLKPLNISVDINLGSKVPKSSLSVLYDDFGNEIDSWRSDIKNKMYDIVKEGLTKEKTLAQITQEISDETKTDLYASKRFVQDAIIDAARKAEGDTLREAGVEIFEWITISDNNTCETCLALAGRMYTDDPMGRGLVNYDNGQFLEDELAELTPDERFIDPAEGKDGPQIHDKCRCHLAPVLTQDQYKGTFDKIVAEVEA